MGHETFAHGATCMSCDEIQMTKERHVTWEKNIQGTSKDASSLGNRFIKSLSEEESVDPNGEKPQPATRTDHGVSGHALRTKASGRS